MSVGQALWLSACAFVVAYILVKWHEMGDE
jgi:hypothetical protein